MPEFLSGTRIYPTGITVKGSHHQDTLYDVSEQRRYLGDLRSGIVKLFSGTSTYGVPSSGYFDDVESLIEYPDILVVHWSADYAKNRTTAQWIATYKAQVQADATAAAQNLKYLLDLGKTVIICIFLEINYYFSDSITGPFGAPPDPTFPIDDFIETQCAAIKGVDSRFVTDVEVAIPCTPQANAHANYPSWNEIKTYITNYIGGVKCPHLDCISISFYPFFDWPNWETVLEQDIATIFGWIRANCPNQQQVFLSEFGRNTDTDITRIEWQSFIKDQCEKNDATVNIWFELGISAFGLIGTDYLRRAIYYQVKNGWLEDPYKNQPFYDLCQTRGADLTLIEKIKTDEDEYGDPVFTEIGTQEKGFYRTTSGSYQKIAGQVPDSEGDFLLPLQAAIDDERFVILYDGVRWRVKGVDRTYAYLSAKCEREA
jgi:hypothetical protein